MKKITILPVLIAIAFCGAAPLFSQPRYGIRAGLNMTNMQYSGRADPYEATAIFQTNSDPRFSFFLGGVVQLDLKKNFTLNGEIQLTGMGYHLQAADSFYDFTEYHARLWYVHIPLTVTARWGGFFAGAGPYLGLGVAGTQEVIKYFPTSSTPFKDKSGTHFGSGSDNHYRRFDFGVQAQAGYSFRNIRLIVSYNLGLLDAINKFYANEGTARHRALGVSAAYFFGAGE